MKSGSCIWTSAVILVASLCTEAEAGSMHRDSSGDAMQRHDSRMMSDSVMRFPGMSGRSVYARQFGLDDVDALAGSCPPLSRARISACPRGSHCLSARNATGG